VRHQVLRQAGYDLRRHQDMHDGVYRFTDECPQEVREWMRAYMVDLRREDG
jgi:hypothetical protein